MGQYKDTFETENFIIRRWRKDDAEDLLQYTLYKTKTGYEAWEEWPTDLEGCRGAAEYFASNETGNCWAVERKSDSRMLGGISFNEVKDRFLDFGHYFTYTLIKSDETIEVLKTMIQYAFDVLDIDAVDARNEKAWIDNTAALFTLGFIELEDKMQVSRKKWSVKSE